MFQSWFRGGVAVLTTALVAIAVLVLVVMTRAPSATDVMTGLDRFLMPIVIEKLKDLEIAKKDNWDHSVKTPLGPVNDGLWQRFSITAKDPERIEVRVTKLERIETGVARAEVRYSVFARGEGQAQLWKLGLKVGDVESVARATVTGRIGCEVRLTAETRTVKVTVTKSELKIEDFLLDNVGPIQGAPAQSLGATLTTLGRGCLEEAEDKLAELLRKALQDAIEKALDESKFGKFVATADREMTSVEMIPIS